MPELLPILIMTAQSLLIGLGTLMSMAGAVGIVCADPDDVRRINGRHRAIAVNLSGLLLFYAGSMIAARMMMPVLV